MGGLLGGRIALCRPSMMPPVEIALSRAAAINGRVVDGVGEPLSRIQVTAMLIRHGNEGMVVGTALSDDRGMFRIGGWLRGVY